MAANFNELFGTTNATVAGSARTLNGTVELTTLASSLSQTIINSMTTSFDVYRPRFDASLTDNRALDEIIDDLLPEYGDKADFLDELSTATIDGMLKSQQSKRSRCKAKQMSPENYKTMMTAAVAERIIRDKTGKVKAAGSAGRHGNLVDYTGAQLEMFAADQEALRKEIRNIKSKKSIMKGKADFDETSERWQSLLRAERQLIDLRVGANHHVVEVEVDHTKMYIRELLGDANINELTADEMRNLLKDIAQAVIAD